MKKVFTVFLILFCMLFFAAQSFAYSLTVNFDPGTTQVTDQLTGFGTTGAMMDGMTVMAYFSDGTSETEFWADTDTVSGEVLGTDWSLEESGDTFGGLWTLANTSSTLNITRIWIDAGTGDSVLDTTYIGDVFGTPGSARGWTFDVQSASNDLEIVATYYDQVGLSGQTPVGDLYRYLDIQFTNPDAFDPGSTLGFIADTDNLQFAGDIQPVPEPATMLLLGTGLVGLAGFGRKKFFKK